MKAQVNFDALGGGGGTASEFDVINFGFDQSSYWTYGGNNCTFDRAFFRPWGTKTANGTKFLFANGVTSGWCKCALPAEHYIDKLVMYPHITSSDKSWYFDLMISTDNGNTWETLDRYTIDSSNSHVGGTDYNTAKTDPHFEMEIKRKITDFKFDFPTQQPSLHNVNNWSMNIIHVIFVL